MGLTWHGTRIHIPFMCTQVFTAKRAAAVRVAEEQGTDKERPQRLSHDAKVRKRQRQADAEAGVPG